jgi:hypothetical protein
MRNNIKENGSIGIIPIGIRKRDLRVRDTLHTAADSGLWPSDINPLMYGG